MRAVITDFVKLLLSGVNVGLWSSTHLVNLQQTGSQSVHCPLTQLRKLHLQNDTVTGWNQSHVRQTVGEHRPAADQTTHTLRSISTHLGIITRLITFAFKAELPAAVC